jgi:hypothetical protein
MHRRRQQIAARLAWELWERRALTWDEAVEISEMPLHHTLVLMAQLAAVLPITTAGEQWRGARRATSRPPRTLVQRGAVLAWYLAGQTLTVRQAAAITGLSRSGSYMALVHLSEVIPIYDSAQSRHSQGSIWSKA